MTGGVLCRHEVFNRQQYWRLSDPSRKPPGVMGWWPSRSTTFLEVRLAVSCIGNTSMHAMHVCSAYLL